MPTCAIYARVSDPSQVKGESIHHQISFCREYARRRREESGEPWTTPEMLIFVDEGVTGTSLLKRPAVQVMLQAARRGDMEVVLFKGISRFARDTVDALLMLRTLIACGVRVISLEENFDSHRDRAEFMFTIHSALAQAESEKTAIRVRIGAVEKAKAGQWNGQPPDGYVLNPDTKKLEIDPLTAPVIERIFALYAAGNGCRQVAEWLNREGYCTRRGRMWTQRTVARILRNPAYAGDVVYGRRAQTLSFAGDDPLRRKKRTVWADADALTVCRDAHPAIVGRDCFERVQHMLRQRAGQPGQRGRSHLLTKGLLKCRCGSSMTVKYNPRGTAYYRCIGRSERGRSFCNERYLRVQDVETAVLRRIRIDVQALLQCDEVDCMVVEGADVRDPDAALQAELDRLLRKSTLLFNQFSEGQLSETQYRHLNEPLRNRITALNRLLQSRQDTETQRGDPAQLQTLFAARLLELLSVPSPDPGLTRRLLEVMLAEVRLVDRQGDAVLIHIAYRFQPC